MDPVFLRREPSARPGDALTRGATHADHRPKLELWEIGVRIVGVVLRRLGGGAGLIEHTLPHEINTMTELEF